MRSYTEPPKKDRILPTLEKNVSISAIKPKEADNLYGRYSSIPSYK